MSAQPKNKLGATPGKLAVVAVLALVLVGVIASNWTSATQPPPAEKIAAAPAEAVPATPPTTNATPETTAATTPASPFAEFAEDAHWPQLPLTQVTKFDPLAKATWAQPVVAAGELPSETQISELLAAQDAIIFVSGQQRVARIGDNEYRVGDRIGRYQISDISSQGVVLSEHKLKSE